ncbi:hypothetical protein ACJRPK_15270 [Aquimarina sp. 2-A2]|uniref:hypothetical protein n=1 Tax=Aquimarina sp. 2-A2 TaxID=3382644 RepID=UPI00387F01F6
METLTNPITDLYNQTSRLTVPKVFPQVFPDDILALRSAVGEMFQNVDILSAGYRVWVDGEKRDSYKQKIINTPVINNDFETWTKEIFGDKKFGIILNGGQEYSDKAKRKIMSYVEPLLKERIPFGGMNCSIFLGNYGFTPIGIHNDHKGSFVLHFHLGPGKKTMYMWEQENYRRNFQERENQTDNIEDLIPFADYSYEFGEGDVFFMPWHYYHIGKSDEFSIGITLWFNYTTVDGVLNGVWENTYTTMFQNELDNDELVPGIRSIEDNSAIEEILSQINEEVAEKPLEDVIVRHIDDYAYALKSNSWFDGIIGKKNIKNEDSELTSTDTIKLNKSEIVYYIKEGEFHFFHQGNKVTLLHHADLEGIIETVNDQQTHNVQRLVEGKFNDWPDEIGVRILEIFLENNFIIKN